MGRAHWSSRRMFQAPREPRMCEAGKVLERAQLETICSWWGNRNEGSPIKVPTRSWSNRQGEASSWLCNIPRRRRNYNWDLYSHSRKPHYLIHLMISNPRIVDNLDQLCSQWREYINICFHSIFGKFQYLTSWFICILFYLFFCLYSYIHSYVS